jgi:hypothetical protein
MGFADTGRADGSGFGWRLVFLADQAAGQARVGMPGRLALFPRTNSSGRLDARVCE